MPASSSVLLPCLRLTPRREKPPSRWPNLTILPPPRQVSASVAPFVKPCCFRPPSQVRNILVCCFVRYGMSDVQSTFCPEHEHKSNVKIPDTVDALTATFAVWRPSSKGRPSATNHGYLHARQVTGSLVHTVGEAWTAPNQWNQCPYCSKMAVLMQDWGQPLDAKLPCARDSLTIHSVQKCSWCFIFYQCPNTHWMFPRGWYEESYV